MNLLRRLRHLFRRRQTEADMAEEMRFHLEQRAADFTAEGLPSADARFAAQRKFGNVASIQEQARAARGWRGLENFVLDLRLGVRALVKSPGFSLLALITLGLGIGANTAMFSLFNGTLLKPLPYPDSAQLVRVYRATAQNRDGHFSPADLLAFQRAMPGHGEVSAYAIASASLAEPGHPAEFTVAARCSANLFSLLGLRPQLGREFRPEEDTPGRGRVVLLSQRAWINRFGGKPDIIGRSVRIDGEPHEVIGVLPETFNDWRHLGTVDIFRPLAFTPEQAADRTGTYLRILVRRATGQSPAELASFVANFGARLAAGYPAVNAESSWRADSLRDRILPTAAPAMIGMMVALSGLVLLIACSNLANLLLARTMARAREFAVRAALGASRTQLLRPLLAEALLLALAGGACAVVLASWFHDFLAMRFRDNGDQVVIAFGWPVLAWAFAASLVTAVAFGLAPGLFALRLDLNQTLKSGGHGATGGPGHRRFRQFLIVGQFTVAMILLAAAGVYIRGLHELNNRRSGWESDNLITGTVLLPAGQYADAEKISAFHRLTLERLAALPGVASVSISSFTPFFNWTDVRKFFVEGRDRPQPGHEPAAAVNCVSPQYFDAVGTRVLAGRAFRERDNAASTKVYILSETTARTLFGGENPIGRRLAQTNGAGSDDLRWGEVVGVVRDVESSTSDANPVRFHLYQPMAQEPRRQFEISVRTAGVAPASLADSIRAAVASLDPDLPVRQLQPADLTIERANSGTAVGRDIISGMAVLGLALASLGIYGIIARTMAQRTGEFAIRLALGATLGNITRIVLTSGVKLACLGSVLGLLGAVGAVRVVAAGNPNMRMNSTAVLIGSTLLLVAVALLACWLPARRAGRIDAVNALRAE
ncbi:MAG: ABC transporter permease [Opitutae bacterium]|nr:ABC transporter permease [Opitutae bacterium]